MFLNPEVSDYEFSGVLMLFIMSYGSMFLSPEVGDYEICGVLMLFIIRFGSMFLSLDVILMKCFILVFLIL